MREHSLPNGWIECHLEDLISPKGVFKDGDWVESKDQDPNGEVRLIQLADIGDGSFANKSSRYLTSNKARQLNCTFLEKEDLLIARMPDPLGRCCIFPFDSEKKFVTVVDVCILRVGNKYIDHKYLMFLINSIKIREKISALQSGSTRKRISRKNLATINFPIAPLNEQKRIVAKIEELFSELDNGIAALKTAQEQLKVYRQAILKHAFEGKLTAKWREQNSGDSWRLKKLGNLITFLTSGSRGWAKYYSDSGDIFIRAQNLKHDQLDLDDKAFVALPEKTEGKRTKVQLDDILITITGANVTKTGRVCTDIGSAYVSQHVALCRPSEDIDSEFMYWFLVAESAGRKQLSKFAYGAGKPGLNLDNIRSVEVNLPSILEQWVIVKQIKELLSIEEKVSSDIEIELHRVELLRQSILKKAFSGKLVLQDPNDEPAHQLLTRIKTTKSIRHGK